MKKQRSVDEAILQAIVQRVVAVAKPDKIILFGSAARGEMTQHSDVDILVVKRGQFNRGHLVEDIYMNLIGVGQAVDVIVVTPEEIERYKDRAALVIYPAVREGRVVYAA